jgi:hypothetical protein
MIANSINNLVNNLLYTQNGRLILSIILGLGLASLFRKLCEGKNCYSFIGPKQNDLRDQIFSYDSKNNKCYALREQTVKCNNSKKSLYFA